MQIRSVSLFNFFWVLVFPAYAQLQLNLSLGHPQADSLTYTHAAPPDFLVRLTYTGQSSVSYLTQGRARINHECLTFILIEEDGTEHRFQPWQGPYYLSKHFNYKSIKPLESYHYSRFNLLTISHHKHWDWWQQVGFKEGKYRLCAVFQYPKSYQKYIQKNPILNLWNDRLLSDTVSFRIVASGATDSYPPHAAQQVMSLNKRGLPKHVVLYNEEGEVVAERLFQQSNGFPNMIQFQIVYDKPIAKPQQWNRMGGIRILEGEGSFGTGHWIPHDSTNLEEIDGEVIFWQRDYKENKIRYRTRYQDGRLHGDFVLKEYFERYTGKFVEGKKEGPWLTIFKEDTIFSCNYKAGILDGLFYMKNAHTGDPIVIRFYDMGVEHGVYEHYNRQGGLWERKAYDQGKAVGTWVWNTYEGKHIAQGTYVDGEPFEGSFLINRFVLASGRGFIIIHRYKDGHRIK
jgi:hypothetical protein